MSTTTTKGPRVEPALFYEIWFCDKVAMTIKGASDGMVMASAKAWGFSKKQVDKLINHNSPNFTSVRASGAELYKVAPLKDKRGRVVCDGDRVHYTFTPNTQYRNSYEGVTDVTGTAKMFTFADGRERMGIVLDDFLEFQEKFCNLRVMVGKRSYGTGIIHIEKFA